jgi:hypothetical protein
MGWSISQADRIDPYASNLLHAHVLGALGWKQRRTGWLRPTTLFALMINAIVPEFKLPTSKKVP